MRIFKNIFHTGKKYNKKLFTINFNKKMDELTKAQVKIVFIRLNQRSK